MIHPLNMKIADRYSLTRQLQESISNFFPALAGQGLRCFKC